MDCGFREAGIETVFANEIDEDAAATYRANSKYVDSEAMRVGDVHKLLPEIKGLVGIDVVFGGPPCQGFSVAGKMDPSDERSQLVWAFMDVVESLKPRLFVMENVKALGTLAKWESVRARLVDLAKTLGYATCPVVLKTSDYGVPQARERFFLIGVKGADEDDLESVVRGKLQELKTTAPTVREAFASIPAYGEEGNRDGSTAEIRLAKNPVLRSSPSVGSLLFNGRGRLVDLDGVTSRNPALCYHMMS